MSQNGSGQLYKWKLTARIMTTTNKSTSNNSLKKIPTTKDNFGLTKSEFDLYVVKLQQGDESLFTKVFSSHFQDSVAYVRMKFKISQELAYDTCMNTMLEFRHKILEGRIQYGNLRYLYTRMAINNYIDEIKKDQKTQSAIDVFLGGNEFEMVDRQEIFEAIDKALDMQDSESKKIIDQLFYVGKHVNQFAEETGVTNATMRKRKQRVLQKVKTAFFDIIKNERSI